MIEQPALRCFVPQEGVPTVGDLIGFHGHHNPLGPAQAACTRVWRCIHSRSSVARRIDECRSSRRATLPRARAERRCQAKAIATCVPRKPLLRSNGDMKSCALRLVATKGPL
jgi:hypothetical protein